MYTVCQGNFSGMLCNTGTGLGNTGTSLGNTGTGLGNTGTGLGNTETGLVYSETFDTKLNFLANNVGREIPNLLLIFVTKYKEVSLEEPKNMERSKERSGQS